MAVITYGAYEWDSEKHQDNIRKHGVRFEDAIQIFERDVFTFPDIRFDYAEEREISYGYTMDLHILMVVHTERTNRTRIISARKATPAERRRYHEYLSQGDF